MRRVGGIACVALAATLLGPVASGIARQEASQSRDLPPALAPFEYLVGRWKGQAVPRDNPSQQFRGWTETHSWAWSFAKGKPAGLTFTIERGKLLRDGTLRHDPTTGRYRLEGTTASNRGHRLVFEGTVDRSGKLLTLERAGERGFERLTLRANSNYVRYTMTLERKAEGALLFKPVIEVGLTKEGESFAAGAGAAERHRCIITGGAAAMTVSHRGQSFPICCTGCRDEFLENPEKYITLLGLKAGAARAKTGAAPSGNSGVSRFDDAFSEDVDQPASKPAAKMSPVDATDAKANRETSSANAVDATKARSKHSEPGTLAARAATLLRLGQNLEKSGKRAAALKQYRQVLKECPNTPSATAAAARIKTLEKP